MSPLGMRNSILPTLKRYVEFKHVHIDQCTNIIQQICTKNTCLTQSEFKQCSVYLSQIILKCNNTNHLKRIHASIDIHTLQNNIYLNSALIQSYAKHSLTPNAITVYNTIHPQSRNTNVTKQILRILINHKHIEYSQKALQIYDKFNDFSDESLNILAIKACVQCKQFEKGRNIISKSHNLSSKHAKTSLITFYGESGDIHSALNIFTSINPSQINEFSISAMMKAYINNAHFDDALKIYEKYMKFTDDLSHLLAIKACTNIKNMQKGVEIHKKLNLKCSKFIIELSNALITFYGQFNDLKNVFLIFNSLHRKQQSEEIYIAMMRALILNKQNQCALDIYTKQCGKTNNNFLHLLAIQACTNLDNYENGTRIHKSFCTKSQSVQLKAALIDFYGHFGEIGTAKNIFYGIEKNQMTKVCVGAIMKALIDCKQNDKALDVYNEYIALHDDICHILAIKACINLNNMQKGMDIHRRLDMAKNDNVRLKNALISFYAHFEDMDNAKNIFFGIENDKKDIVGLSAMMNGFVQSGMSKECIHLFKSNHDKIKSDAISYAILFKACTQSTNYHFGQTIHQRLDKEMLNDLSIQINLIGMYGKCGILKECLHIFEASKHKEREIGIWNAMIYAFGRNGKMENAQDLFDQMKNENGFLPDVETYKLLLNACSHCGEVERAKMLWNEICDDEIKYDRLVINPYIDCLCRKGLLKEAKQLIGKYNANDEVVWTSLLNGYKMNKSSLHNDEMNNISEHILNTFGSKKHMM